MTLSLGHLVGHNTIELVYRTRMCVFPPASHNITSKINLLPSPSPLLPPTVTHSNTIPQPCMPLLRYFISAIIVGMVCCGLLMHAYHHNSILVCISSFAQLLSCFEVFLPL